MVAAAKKPVLAKEARKLDYVKDDKVYRVVIQLGSNTRWRNMAGGRWVVDQDVSTQSGKQAYRHIPAVHECPPFSGRTVNGLIAKHNQWVQNNRDNARPLGDVNRQLLVIDIKETDEEPIDRHAGLTSLSDARIAKIAASVAKGVVQEILKAQK